jgi:hypothetical protein
MKSFVWLPSQSGPQAQIWSERPVDGNSKLKVIPLFEIKLTAITNLLSINSLILKYPKPEELKDD